MAVAVAQADMVDIVEAVEAEVDAVVSTISAHSRVI